MISYRSGENISLKFCYSICTMLKSHSANTMVIVRSGPYLLKTVHSFDYSYYWSCIAYIFRSLFENWINSWCCLVNLFKGIVNLIIDQNANLDDKWQSGSFQCIFKVNVICMFKMVLLTLIFFLKHDILIDYFSVTQVRLSNFGYLK